MLGERVSASTVSRVAKTLDQAVESFHQRKLINRYRALVLDGVVLSRKTGAGAIKRPVLVALGILPDGRKEVLDFRLSQRAPGESEQNDQWRAIPTAGDTSTRPVPQRAATEDQPSATRGVRSCH